jgi:hypothetical protein
MAGFGRVGRDADHANGLAGLESVLDVFVFS